MSGFNLDHMIEQVELNLGSWKPEAVAIVDINYKVWGEKGKVPRNCIEYYKKFPLLEMHEGDTVHNSNTFLMKVTEKTGIIVMMKDSGLARLSAINLRGRLNALSDFYSLDKLISEKSKDKRSRLDDAAKTEEEIW
ncbi:MAG: hypothetical protein QXO71_05350 [Candidatus Jordarchaeaceae archaeon]